jgi:hypothetical protein
MILDHVNIMHYLPVNIDETDASWQMETNPSHNGRLSKNRETK